MAVNYFNVMDLGKARLLDPEQMGYMDSLEIIKDESVKVQKSFVKIGWYLKHIKDHELYLEDGYANIYECAAGTLGYSQSTTSRFIKICEKFSKNGNSPELDEKYAGFDKSQMIEMLPLEQEQLEQVTPKMTVAQIRKVKSEKKSSDEEAENEIPGQMGSEKYATSHKNGEINVRKDEPKEAVIDGEYKEIDEPEVATSQYVALLIPNDWHEEYLNAFAKYFISCEKDWMLEDFLNRVLNTETIPQEIKNHLKPHCRTWSFKVNEGVAKINLFDDYVQLFDKCSVYMGNFEWFYLAAAIQRMWNIVSLEEAKVPEQEKEQPVAKRQDDTEPQEEEGQLELPILKNDSQRREWLRNYKVWGLWYRDKNIDVNYYKFDFADGSRLVVAEYPQRRSYWTATWKDECFYHLLEKNKKGYDGVYDEIYRHKEDCETYLIEFLKKIQRMGEKNEKNV